VSVEKGIVSNLGRDSQDFNVWATRLQFNT
jgi:hypothetical protein